MRRRSLRLRVNRSFRMTIALLLAFAAGFGSPLLAQGVGLARPEVLAIRDTYKAGHTEWTDSLSEVGIHLLIRTEFMWFNVDERGIWRFRLGGSHRLGSDTGKRRDPIVLDRVLTTDSLIITAIDLYRSEVEDTDRPFLIGAALRKVKRYSPTDEIASKLTTGLGGAIRELPPALRDSLLEDPRYSTATREAIAAHAEFQSSRLAKVRGVEKTSQPDEEITDYLVATVETFRRETLPDVIPLGHLLRSVAEGDSLLMARFGSGRGEYIVVEGELGQFAHPDAIWNAEGLEALAEAFAENEARMYFITVWSDEVVRVDGRRVTAALESGIEIIS